jgi:hypothetical protein
LIYHVSYQICKVLIVITFIQTFKIHQIILFLGIPGLDRRWEEIGCYFLLYAQNELPEVRISALKALQISTRLLTKSQRQNYYCIITTLIKSNTTGSIRNETLSCFKEAAKYYKEEINTDIIHFNISNLNRK